MRYSIARIAGSAALVASTLAMQPASAAEVLVNGSFENGPAANNPGYHRGAPAPDGWSAIVGLEVPDVIFPGYSQGGYPFQVLLTAQAGDRFLDTNGFTRSGGLYQDITGLAPGTTATLSYYVGQWAQNSAGALFMSLVDPSSNSLLNTLTTVITFNNQATSSAWFVQSFSALVPASGALRVQFYADSTSYDRGGPGLDNMSLEATRAAAAVPEPASWALMFAGFGIVGSALRRRASRLAVA